MVNAKKPMVSRGKKRQCATQFRKARVSTSHSGRTAPVKEQEITFQFRKKAHGSSRRCGVNFSLSSVFPTE